MPATVIVRRAHLLVLGAPGQGDPVAHSYPHCVCQTLADEDHVGIVSGQIASGDHVLGGEIYLGFFLRLDARDAYGKSSFAAAG